MTYPEQLVSLNLERQALAGFINFPNTLIELSSNITEKEFSNKVHCCVFSILKNSILAGEKIEKVILAQKVKELGINFFEQVNIFEYIDDITFSQIQPNGVKEVVKELVKLRIRRDLHDNAITVLSYIKDCGNKGIDEIIHHVDGIYNSQVGLYSSDEDPQDLYENVEAFIRKIAQNPVDECGLTTPFSYFNKVFGGLREGNGAYNIISRAGEGKSTFLFNMSKGVAKLNNCKVLYLDTEMDLDLNMFRAAAAEGQVNAWFLETGNWTKNSDLSKKVISSFDRLKQYKGHIYHKYVPNKGIDELRSMCKRWFYKYVGRGNKAMIVYDYLKITGKTADFGRAEYQDMGDKLSYLNEMGAELGVPIFTATQQNRSGEQNGTRNDDSTTVSISDRINWLVAWNAVFRNKTVDEISEHGVNFGTHLLKPFKTSRTQGKENWNNNRTVRTVDPRNTSRVVYKPNFINYEISEYELIEKGTYKDVVNVNQLNVSLQGQPNNNPTDI